MTRILTALGVLAVLAGIVMVFVGIWVDPRWALTGILTIILGAIVAALCWDL